MAFLQKDSLASSIVQSAWRLLSRLANAFPRETFPEDMPVQKCIDESRYGNTPILNSSAKFYRSDLWKNAWRAAVQGLTSIARGSEESEAFRQLECDHPRLCNKFNKLFRWFCGRFIKVRLRRLVTYREYGLQIATYHDPSIENPLLRMLRYAANHDYKE